jgi:ubiquinone/menaquinone biosynthesis C-methylase UbiE
MSVHTSTLAHVPLLTVPPSCVLLLQVLREAARVCRPGGQIILLQHGRSVETPFPSEQQHVRCVAKSATVDSFHKLGQLVVWPHAQRLAHAMPSTP